MLARKAGSRQARSSRSWQQRAAYTLAAIALLVAPNAQAKGYRVQPGDSLWALAKRFGVSVEAIKSANKLQGDGIKAGQKLNIPGGKAAQKSSGDSKQASKKQRDKDKKSPKSNSNKSTSKSSPSSTSHKSEPQTSKSSTSSKSKDDRSKHKKSSATKTASSKPKTASHGSTATNKAKSKAEKTSIAKASSSTQTPKPKAASPVKHVKRQVEPKPLGYKEREAAVALYSKDTPRTAPDSLAERAPAWVMEPPPDRTQVEKSNAARGGVYPCAAPDNGFGNYDKWTQVAPMAHVLAPTHINLGEDGQFDVVFHFHGREPIRKEWVEIMKSEVLVAIDIGIDSSSYSRAFEDPRTFRQVLRAVEQYIATQSGDSRAHAQRVGLSAWSAGYGAVEKILAQPFGKQVVDSVILLDGLHSGYTAHSLDGERLAPFVEFAQRAQSGEKLMFVSHSSIRTVGYASTTETAQYLTWKVGGKPEEATPLRNDPMGLERVSTYSDGNFHVRGFAGKAAADHCAQIALMSDVLRVHVKPRWAEPVPTKIVSTGAPSRLALQHPEK